MSDETINWWNTSFGEDEICEISNAIKGRNISQGKVTQGIENLFARIVGSKFAAATPNGTTAILMALHAAGIRPGDEVLVPCLTAIGSANAIYGLGARPVFFDVEKDRPIGDISSLVSKINHRTRGILLVHHNGEPANTQAAMDIAKQFNLSLIEDAAQAMFSKNGKTFLGTDAIAGCFSFSVAKIISSGQGGIVVTSDEDIFQKMMNFKLQDRENYENVSFNLKFTDIQAAMLLPQLKNYVSRVSRLVEIYLRYREGFKDLAGLDFLDFDVDNGNLPLWSLAIAEESTALLKSLEVQRIKPLRWPRPLNEASWFQDTDSYPNALNFASKGLRLPCGPSISNSDIDRTIEAIRNFYLHPIGPQ